MTFFRRTRNSSNGRALAYLSIVAYLVTVAMGVSACGTQEGSSSGDGDETTGDGGEASGDGDLADSSGGSVGTGGGSVQGDGDGDQGGSGGAGTGGSTSLKNCDYSQVTAEDSEPCDYGTVHEIINGEFGPCVPIDECGCGQSGSQGQCGDGLTYVCYTAGHCGHLVH